MIWADRIAVVLAVPVVLLALAQDESQASGLAKWSTDAKFLVIIWIILRGLDFIVSGAIRGVARK